MIKSFTTELRTFNLSRLLHVLIYPFLVGFLLDLPWINQSVIALAFVLATLFVGDFVEALLALWQATAVAGLLFVMIDYFGPTGVNPHFAALSIPLIWFAVLVLRRSRNLRISKLSNKLTASDVVGISFVLFCSTTVSHGRLRNFGFLAAEDNERWLTSIITVIRGGKLTLASGFDSYSVQYFTKFFLNGFLYLLGPNVLADPEESLLSLNILANAWMFALVTSILLSIRLAVRLLAYIQPNSKNFVHLFVVGLLSILFFRTSHDSGHFPQFLLNVVIMVFMASIIDVRPADNAVTKLMSGIVLLAISLGVVGSYNPWFPISIGCIFLTANSLVRGTIIRRIFRSTYRFLFLLICLTGGFFAFKILSKKYGGLDDRSGVWAVPLEAVWIVVIVLFFGAIELIRKRVAGVGDNSSDGESSGNYFSKVFALISFVTLVMSFALDIERNQVITVALVLLVGLVFNRDAIKCLRRSFRNIYNNFEFDGITLLGLGSFLYASLIYLMSRFVGPVYESLYAANKSMLAVFGQFAWLLFLLLSTNSQQFVGKLFQFKTAVIAMSFLVVLGALPYIAYRDVQLEWWQQPALKSIAEYPDAVIVCANQDWRLPNFEIYNCNRFLQTLTSFEYPASGFRYLAWYQPEQFESISDWFGGSNRGAEIFTSDTKVIVLSRGELNLESKQIFNDVASDMIEYQIIK